MIGLQRKGTYYGPSTYLKRLHHYPLQSAIVLDFLMEFVLGSGPCIFCQLVMAQERVSGQADFRPAATT